MGTIKIGSSANRKGITVDPNVVLFNGSNVKKIMSGLTTIWENIKALVPVMTSNTMPYGETSASSGNSDAWKAFNGTTSDRNDMWVVTGTNSGWIQYKFISPAIVSKVSITNRNASDNPCSIKNFTVQGSNDNSAWADLGSFVKSDGALNTETFSFNNNTAYLYYRISIQSCHGNDMGVGEMQFYGTQLVGLIPTNK